MVVLKLGQLKQKGGNEEENEGKREGGWKESLDYYLLHHNIHGVKMDRLTLTNKV